jgi:hypothetical protein
VSDVYIYLVRSLNTAGKVGRLSISRILKTLDFFGFGKDLCNWVKTFYTDQTSCILNNGHCSDFFDITRGVRQEILFLLIFLFLR